MVLKNLLQSDVQLAGQAEKLQGGTVQTYVKMNELFSPTGLASQVFFQMLTSRLKC